MAKHGVTTLIYSSTCATYGEPDKMPITEETPQVAKLTVALVFYDSLVFGFHNGFCTMEL